MIRPYTVRMRTEDFGEFAYVTSGAMSALSAVEWASRQHAANGHRLSEVIAVTAQVGGDPDLMASMARHPAGKGGA